MWYNRLTVAKKIFDFKPNLPFMLTAGFALAAVAVVSLAFASRADSIIQQLLTQNVAPVADSATLSLTSEGPQLNELTLTEGEDTAVHVYGTVEDMNGCHDLKKITAVLYRSDLGANCTPDQNNCYVTSTTAFGGCSGAVDTSANYDAVFNVPYFADATDVGSEHATSTWVARVTVSDQGNLTSSATALGFEIDSIAALGVSQTLNFGILPLGEISDPTPIYLSNQGNRQIVPYFVSDGDFSCNGELSSPISSANLHMHTAAQVSPYMSVTTFPNDNVSPIVSAAPNGPTLSQTVLETLWNQGLSMASQVTQTYEEAVAVAPDYSSAPMPVYFTLKVPATGVIGNCTTVLRVTAVPE